MRPATRPIGPPKIVLPSPLTFIGRRKEGRHRAVQERLAAYAESPRLLRHEGPASRVRSLIPGDRSVAIARARPHRRENKSSRAELRPHTLDLGESGGRRHRSTRVLRPTVRSTQLTRRTACSDTVVSKQSKSTASAGPRAARGCGRVSAGRSQQPKAHRKRRRHSQFRPNAAAETSSECLDDS